jgi:hypothetical protein
MHHSTLKNTPNYILLGLEPHLPGEPPELTEKPSRHLPLTERDWCLAKALELALQGIRQRSLTQQQERNEHRIPGPEYAPGDQVLVYIGNSLLGQASKFADRFVGPLTVTRPHGGNHYALLGKDGREYKARKEELKRYVPEEADSHLHPRATRGARGTGECAARGLPHMQPDVRQSGFSGSNRSVRIQGIRRIWRDRAVHRHLPLQE